MPEFLGKLRPITSLSAVVIRKDGTRVDLGVIAGKGSDDPEEIKKGRKGRDLIDRLIKKERKEQRNG